MLVGLALTANLPLGVFPARQSLEELLGYHSTTPDAKSAQRSELNAAQGMDALGGADVKEDDRKGNAAEGDAVIADRLTSQCFTHHIHYGRFTCCGAVCPGG